MGGWDFIENRFHGQWRIFGESKDGTRVDVADIDDLTLVPSIPREYAEKAIERHNNVLDCLTEMAIAFSDANEDAFHKFWWKD